MVQKNQGLMVTLRMTGGDAGWLGSPPGLMTT